MSASVLFLGSLGALHSPDDHVERFREIEPVLKKLGFPPVLVSGVHLLSRLAGFITVASVLGSATGKCPHTCAALFAAVNFPVVAMSNPIWMTKAPGQRRNYTRGLVVETSLVGGLGVAVFDDGGQPSKWIRHKILYTTKMELAK